MADIVPGDLPVALGLGKKERECVRRPEGKSGGVLSPEAKMESALEKYTENKSTAQMSSLKAILKILQKVEKKPNDVRSRRLQMKNIVVKKFITGVKGAIEFMNACGYQEVEIGDKKTKYLVLKDVDKVILQLGIQRIQARIADIKSGKVLTVSKPKPVRVICKGGCGFYGSSDTNGLCSVCYNKTIFGAAPPISSSSTKKEKKDFKKHLKRVRTKLAAVYRFRMGVKKPKTIQKNKKRCFTCNKKVGYLGFECRCMYVYCEAHRLPAQHFCTFDYRKHQSSRLARENKKVVHSKLTKLE